MHGDNLSPLEPLSKSRSKFIIGLSKSGSRRSLGLFLVEGWRSVISAAKAGAAIEEIVVRHDTSRDERLSWLQKTSLCPVYTVGASQSSRLASVVNDQGVLAIVRSNVSSIDDVLSCRRVLALDGVQDPGNVGTLIRSAAWFGFDAILAGPGTADYFGSKVVRSAAGALWDVKTAYSKDLSADLDRLAGAGHTVVGADVAGDELGTWISPEKGTLVLGSEGNGLGGSVRAKVKVLIRIDAPTDPVVSEHRSGVESLNVGVAGSIIMHAWVNPKRHTL